MINYAVIGFVIGPSTSSDTSANATLCNQCGLSVCLSFFLLCWQDYCKRNRPILLKLVIVIGPTSWKNWLACDGDPVPDTDSGSLFHFPHCGLCSFCSCVLAVYCLMHFERLELFYIEHLRGRQKHFIAYRWLIASTKVLCPIFDKIEILISGDRLSIFRFRDKML